MARKKTGKRGDKVTLKEFPTPTAGSSDAQEIVEDIARNSDIEGIEDCSTEDEGSAPNTGSDSYSKRVAGCVEGSGIRKTQRKLQLEPLPEPAVEEFPGQNRGNRTTNNGSTLNFVAPTLIGGKVVAKLKKTELEREEEKWKTTLIGFVLGDRPSFKQMEAFVKYTWEGI